MWWQSFTIRHDYASAECCHRLVGDFLAFLKTNEINTDRSAAIVWNYILGSLTPVVWLIQSIWEKQLYFIEFSFGQVPVHTDEE